MISSSILSRDEPDDALPDPKGRRPWVLRFLGIALLILLGVFVWGYLRPKPQGFAPTEAVAPLDTSNEWQRFTIDATNRDEFALFAFEDGRRSDSSLERSDWDLAFKRTTLLTNSGATNPKGLSGAMDLGEISPEGAAPPAAVIFQSDELGGDDDELMNPAISDWYNYSFMTHTVHAKDNVYLVRISDLRHVLVKFESYYCQDEAPGCITFHYKLLSAGPVE